MDKFIFKTIIVFFIYCSSFLFCSESLAEDNQVNEKNGIVIEQVFNKVRANNNWKSALLTGKHAQIVFMTISPITNPKNEIGMEVHPFDQVILVVEGTGKAVLSGKTWSVNTGDIIFIPQGVAHNVINLSPNNAPMKIMSFYSSQDIPVKAEYAKKTDEKK